jgi:hypothetical protein
MRDFPRLALASLALLALAGCGSSRSTEGSGSTTGVINAPYERALNTWLDKPEEELVAAWGVPERSQRLTDGGQALEYRRANNDGDLLCTTLFTSDVYGMIRTWAYRGAECKAPKLGDYGKHS